MAGIDCVAPNRKPVAGFKQRTTNEMSLRVNYTSRAIPKRADGVDDSTVLIDAKQSRGWSTNWDPVGDRTS